MQGGQIRRALWAPLWGRKIRAATNPLFSIGNGGECWVPRELNHGAAHVDRVDDPAPGIDNQKQSLDGTGLEKCLQPAPHLDDRRQPVSDSAAVDPVEHFG